MELEAKELAMMKYMLEAMWFKSSPLQMLKRYRHQLTNSSAPSPIILSLDLDSIVYAIMTRAPSC